MDDVRRPAHFHAGRGGANFELNVDALDLVACDEDVILHQRLEAGSSGCQAVRALLERRNLVVALVVGNDFSQRNAGCHFLDCDFHPGHNSSGWVGHGAPKRG